jgi:heme exporter protein A
MRLRLALSYAHGYEASEDLTVPGPDRIVRKPTLRPAKSSMPQTTIYVSPRSLGAFDERPPAVVTTDLARLFRGSPALAGVSLRMRAGACVALLGPNGAGKTTLLRLLATAIAPSYGRAEVDGLDVGRDPEGVRERVAYLSHATALYDDLSARENLAFAATMLDTPDAAARVTRALADVGLDLRADNRVGTFSAGMRRRLALGRILLGQASLVLLDEPTAALDAQGFELILQLLDAWREAGVSVLLASHSGDRLEDRIDARVVLDRGLVAEVSGQGVTWTPPAPSPEPRPVAATR